MAKDGYPAITQGMAMGNGRARMVYPRQTMDFFATSFLVGSATSIRSSTRPGSPESTIFALFLGYERGWNRSVRSRTRTHAHEAVQSQLGLKLEQEERSPVEIIARRTTWKEYPDGELSRVDRDCAGLVFDFRRKDSYKIFLIENVFVAYLGYGHVPP